MDPPWRIALERHASEERIARHDLANRVTNSIAGHVTDRDELLLRLEGRIRDLEAWQAQQKGARAVLTVLGIAAGVVSAGLVILDKLGG